MVFFPPFHEAEIEQHFLLSLFVLEEEAIDGQIQDILSWHWRLEVQGRRHGHITKGHDGDVDSRASERRE